MTNRPKRDLVAERLDAEAVIDGHMPPSAVGRHVRRQLEGIPTVAEFLREGGDRYAEAAERQAEQLAAALEDNRNLEAELDRLRAKLDRTSERTVAPCEAAVSFGNQGFRCELEDGHPDWHKAGELRWNL